MQHVSTPPCIKTLNHDFFAVTRRGDTLVCRDFIPCRNLLPVCFNTRRWCAGPSCVPCGPLRQRAAAKKSQRPSVDRSVDGDDPSRGKMPTVVAQGHRTHQHFLHHSVGDQEFTRRPPIPAATLEGVSKHGGKGGGGR